MDYQDNRQAEAFPVEERRPLNTVEKLLQYDEGLLKVPTGEVKLKLKKLGGEEFSFPIQAIDPEVMSDLKEQLVQMDTDTKKVSINGSYNMDVMIILEGCPKIFRDKTLLDHFKAVTPKELIKKLLVAGEIEDLKVAIEKLSGFETDKDKKDKVKN